MAAQFSHLLFTDLNIVISCQLELWFHIIFYVLLSLTAYFYCIFTSYRNTLIQRPGEKEWERNSNKQFTGKGTKKDKESNYNWFQPRVASFCLPHTPQLLTACAWEEEKRHWHCWQKSRGLQLVCGAYTEMNHKVIYLDIFLAFFLAKRVWKFAKSSEKGTKLPILNKNSIGAIKLRGDHTLMFSLTNGNTLKINYTIHYIKYNKDSHRADTMQ